MKVLNTNDITPTKINVLIIGDSGVGKTYCARTLKGKTLVLSFESGLLSLKDSGIDYIEFNSKDEIKNVTDLVKVLSGDLIREYDNIYFDSLTAIADCFIAYCKNEYPDPRQTLQMFGALKKKLSGFIKYTRDLDKNIYFTALPKTTTDDVGRRFTNADIPGSLSSSLGQYFDFVFYLQIHKKDDENIRAFLTANRDGFLGKDRSGKLNEFEVADLGLVINKVFNKDEKDV